MISLSNLTLGKKITLLTALGLLIGFGVFSTLGMRAVNQATETMLQDRLTTARLVADYLDEALGRALTELKNTAQMIEINGAEEDLKLQIEALEDTYSRLSIHTHSIYLLNQEGRVIWSKPETLRMRGSNLSSNTSIDLAANKGEANISGLVSAPMTDTPVVFLSSPTRQGRQGDKGMLIVAIDLAQSSIGGFIQPIRLGQTGYVEIVDQNGIVVTRTQPGPKLAPFEKSDHSGRFAALISAGKPTRGVCHTCHEPEQRVEKKDVLAFVPLSNAAWGVVIRQSEEEALAPISELRQSLFFFGVILATIALFFVIITTRNIGSRIRTLTNVSQRMAEGDLISPVSNMGQDEVGILAQTIDDMRIKLKSSYGDLEQRTKELSSLLSVSDILTSTLDLSSLLDAVVAKAVEIISGADGGVLLLQSTDQGSLVIQCAVGLEKETLPHSILIPSSKSPSDSIPELVDEEQRDVIKEAVTSFLQGDALRSKVQSSICSGVFYRGRYIGSLIMVSFRDTQTYTDSDYRLLQAIADDIAIAFERAQLTKEAEEARALHEADRLRSEFISSISHELRTPLTLIKGYSTSLLRQDTSWDKNTQREFLRIIDEKTDELRDLIDKLMQSAKLEAGALKLEKEPVLIPRLSQKIVEDVTSRAKKHKFSLNFTPSFPVVDADLRCMEQVLRNLVENAVKYSPESSEIVIAGEFKADELMVSVSDSGQGISLEHQGKVFERFYRIDSPLTRSKGGSGLGLFIVKGHIEAHGGKVWLKSSIGKGSSFYFSLPLNQDENGEQELEKGSR